MTRGQVTVTGAMCSVMTVTDPDMMQKALHSFVSMVIKYHFSLSSSPISYLEFEEYFLLFDHPAER